MPRRNTPLTLQNLTIKKISRVLLQRNRSSSPVAREESNPFLSYSKGTVEDLFGAFTQLMLLEAEQCFIQGEILEMFLSCKMETLRLYLKTIPRDKWLETLEMLIPFSPSIRDFDIWLAYDFKSSYESQTLFMRKYLAEPLSRLGCRMVNLVCLNLHGICSFQLYNAIAQSCLCLRSLMGVPNCVTEDILKCLYMNVNDPADRSPRCQSLEVIKAQSDTPNISNECIVELLNHLPKLTNLDGFQLQSALNEAHRNGTLKQKTYNLISYNNFHSKADGISYGFLISSVCPFLRSLFLSDPTVDELAQFQKLSHLMSLNICSTYLNPELFEAGILPLLETTGKTIESMTFFMFTIDFFRINQLCPHLESLECYDIEEVTETPELQVRQLGRLKTLRVYAFAADAIPTRSIKLLLTCCPNLQELHFSGAENMTNRLMKDILCQNHFTCLKCLHLMDDEDSMSPSIKFFITRNEETLKIFIQMEMSRLLFQLFLIRTAIKESKRTT